MIKCVQRLLLGVRVRDGRENERHANRTHLNSFNSLARTPSREKRWGEKKQNMRHDIVGYADKRRGKLCSCHVSIKITIWNGHTSCDKCTCRIRTITLKVHPTYLIIAHYNFVTAVYHVLWRAQKKKNTETQYDLTHFYTKSLHISAHYHRYYVQFYICSKTTRLNLIFYFCVKF